MSKLSEEEKKAIEYFKEKIKNKLPLYEETYIDGELYRINILQLETKFTEEQANKMEILLNLIEKQQKELEQEQEKEKNKKQFETLCRYEDTLGHYECEVFNELGEVINIHKLSELDEIRIIGKRYISQERIMQEIKNIEKRMETTTNSTEYLKLHCAQEYLRGLLWEV